MTDPTAPPSSTNRRLAATAPKTCPALATSTVLILARIWNANGAEHSIGDAALMGTLATAAAIAGGLLAAGRNGDSSGSTVAFTTAGTLAAAGVAAYADGLALPLLLWVVATVLAYVVAARHWRMDRRAAVAFDRATVERHETQRHVETVEVIRAQAQVQAAAYATALAEAITARQALPGFDPTALVAGGLTELPAREQ